MSLHITEAAKAIGVSAATLKRWFRGAKVADVARDRNGYRIFETEDIERIRAFANRRTEPPPPPVGDEGRGAREERRGTEPTGTLPRPPASGPRPSSPPPWPSPQHVRHTSS